MASIYIFKKIVNNKYSDVEKPENILESVLYIDGNAINA